MDRGVTVTCHMSPVTCHHSPVTCHLTTTLCSFKGGGVSDPVKISLNKVLVNN